MKLPGFLDKGLVSKVSFLFRQPINMIEFWKDSMIYIFIELKSVGINFPKMCLFTENYKILFNVLLEKKSKYIFCFYTEIFNIIIVSSLLDWPVIPWIYSKTKQKQKHLSHFINTKQKCIHCMKRHVQEGLILRCNSLSVHEHWSPKINYRVFTQILYDRNEQLLFNAAPWLNLRCHAQKNTSWAWDVVQC